jgi:ABC-type antimicrobial peptide transport system ATPase subunit
MMKNQCQKLILSHQFKKQASYIYWAQKTNLEKKHIVAH